MNLITLTLFLPLIGSIFSGLCIIYNFHRKAEIVSTVLLIFSALSSIYLYLNIDNYSDTIILYNWLNFSDINLELLDNTMIMIR